jgi:hypothetical protein
MTEKQTLERAREDARGGKSPSTQAGEFVREEIHHIGEGKHGAASPKQAVAIGLSKARRAGVRLPTPTGRNVSSETKEKAQRDSRRDQSDSHHTVSAKRSGATSQALKKKGRSAASKSALSNQTRTAARKQGAAARDEAAVKASRTRKVA